MCGSCRWDQVYRALRYMSTLTFKKVSENRSSARSKLLQNLPIERETKGDELPASGPPMVHLSGHPPISPAMQSGRPATPHARLYLTRNQMLNLWYTYGTQRVTPFRVPVCVSDVCQRCRQHLGRDADRAGSGRSSGRWTGEGSRGEIGARLYAICRREILWKIPKVHLKVNSPFPPPSHPPIRKE